MYCGLFQGARRNPGSPRREALHIRYVVRGVFEDGFSWWFWKNLLDDVSQAISFSDLGELFGLFFPSASGRKLLVMDFSGNFVQRVFGSSLALP